jgi:hypothetical protein
MALDQVKAADLPDPNKNDSRQRLLNLISQRLDGGSDQEIELMLRQLDRGATGEQSKGRGMSLDQLRTYLRGKGLSEDDIRTACDLSLGIGRSAKFGGGLGGGEGGALHAQTSRPDRETAARDQPILTEELQGCEPIRSNRGDSAMRPRLAGDNRSFEAAFGMLPALEAALLRRRPSEKALAMDARRAASFHEMFPNAKRIGTSEHDFSAR